jgi:hypothetical protein
MKPNALLLLTAIVPYVIVACASQPDDDTASGAGAALSTGSGSKKSPTTGKSTSPPAPKAQPSKSGADAGTAEQACFTKCVGSDPKAKQILSQDLACFKPCEKKAAADQPACIQACDQTTFRACTASPDSCDKLDACSEQCFADEGTLFPVAAPAMPGGADDMTDPCDDAYYASQYDTISGLDADDDLLDDLDDDGFPDSDWDDMEFRYGSNRFQCWDY